MRTPAGFECRYFYGNYFRGRKQEECRLIDERPGAGTWTPDLCKTCPVPGILRANACEHMVLEARVEKRLLGLRRQVAVSAYCTHSQQAVAEPEIGCGQCHPIDNLFAKG